MPRIEESPLMYVAKPFSWIGKSAEKTLHKERHSKEMWLLLRNGGDVVREFEKEAVPMTEPLKNALMHSLSIEKWRYFPPFDVHVPVKPLGVTKIEGDLHIRDIQRINDRPTCVIDLTEDSPEDMSKKIDQVEEDRKLRFFTSKKPPVVFVKNATNENLQNFDPDWMLELLLMEKQAKCWRILIHGDGRNGRHRYHGISLTRNVKVSEMVKTKAKKILKRVQDDS